MINIEEKLQTIKKRVEASGTDLRGLFVLRIGSPTKYEVLLGDAADGGETVIEMNEETFEALVSGKISAPLLYYMGKIKVSNLAMLTQLEPLVELMKGL